MAGPYTTKLAYMVIKLKTKMSENVMKSFYNLKKTSLMILKELRWKIKVISSNDQYPNKEDKVNVLAAGLLPPTNCSQQHPSSYIVLIH